MIMEGYDFTDLTEQDKIFCEEYIIDFNATRAARAAGYGEHFKVNAYKKLQLDRIIKYIDFLKSKTAELAGVTILRNAKELAKIAYGEIQEDGKVKEYNPMHRIKAIETLNKMFGFNSPEKAEISGKDGAPIGITGMVIRND